MSGLTLEFKNDENGMPIKSYMSLTDHFGTSIGKDDYILHMHYSGSSIRYNAGKVVDYDYATQSITCKMLDRTRLSILSNFNNIIVMSKEQLAKRYPKIEEL